MAKIKPGYDEVRIPFNKMTFSPDVPSTALGPNEYNLGKNVEADIRGIRAISGDEEILPAVTGTPTFITAGFRPVRGQVQPRFYTIVATVEGKWWAIAGGSTWHDITPVNGVGTYTQAQNITESWNGIIPFISDEQNAPFFWPYDENNEWPQMIMYSQKLPLGIDSIAVDGGDPTAQVITLDSTQIEAPFVAGEYITISGINQYYNGTYKVKSSTLTTITYYAVPGAAYPGGSVGTVAPAYAWNYNPNWKEVYPKFMRLYNTPNVGCVLVAANLVATPQISITGDTSSGSPTLATTSASADMVGATITGPGIPANTTISSVSVGVSITMNHNATATNTGVGFNLAFYNNKELYPVTVQWSQAFGLNQAPATWEPTITNVANQLEVPLRGEAVDGFPCNGQFFISSYWDTVVLSPINYTTTSVPILGVRLANQGRGMLTSNCWANTDKLVYGMDARDVWVFDGQDFTGIGNQRVKNWLFNQIDANYTDRIHMQTNTQKNQIEIYYTSKSIYGTSINGVPNKMVSYRYDIDCWNAPRDVSSATFACESPVRTYNSGTSTWTYEKPTRTTIYARGVANSQIVQKDQGYSFINNASIQSAFRRDNIKLLPDYSGKLMVHRLMPEAINLNDQGLPLTPGATPAYEGTISVQVEGSNSVGQPVQDLNSEGMDINTDYPWVQITQNAHRVNSLELGNTSNTNIWLCSATTWQYTQVEDDR